MTDPRGSVSGQQIGFDLARTACRSSARKGRRRGRTSTRVTASERRVARLLARVAEPRAAPGGPESRAFATARYERSRRTLPSVTPPRLISPPRTWPTPSSRSPRRIWSRSTRAGRSCGTSRSRSGRARSSACSAPTARARPRPSTWSSAWSGRTTARSPRRRGHHRAADVPARAARHQLSAAGAVGVPQADGRGQPAGDLRDPGPAARRAASGARPAARGVRDHAHRAEPGYSLLGRRAAAGGDRAAPW